MSLPGKQKLTEFKKRPRPPEEIQAINAFRAGFGDNDEVKVEEKEHTGQLQESSDFKGAFEDNLGFFFYLLFKWASIDPSPRTVFDPYTKQLLNLAQESPDDFNSRTEALETPAIFVDDRLLITSENPTEYKIDYVNQLAKTYRKYTNNDPIPFKWSNVNLDALKSSMLSNRIINETEYTTAFNRLVDNKIISLEKVWQDIPVTKQYSIEKCFYRKNLFDKVTGFENLDFIHDLLTVMAADFKFMTNLCISLDIHNKIDKNIKFLPRRERDTLLGKTYNEDKGGLYDDDWIKTPDADKSLRDFFVESLDKCEYYLKYGKKVVKRQMINIVAKNEFLPKELFTKKEYENYDEEDKIRKDYMNALKNFEYVLTTWKNNITNDITAKVIQREDAMTLLGVNKNDAKSGVERYIDDVVFTQIYEYIQFLKIQEDQIAKNKALSSDNFRLRKLVTQLEEEKKNNKWKTTTEKPGDLNQPLLRLQISEELNKGSPLFKFAELVAGTLVKNTATLFKINIEDAILEEIKRKSDKGSEKIIMGGIIDEFITQINETALRPIFLRCLLSAKDSVDNMFMVVNLNPLPIEKLMDVGVAFAALVGAYIVQDEETSKVISTTKNDKTQLDQTIFRRNLELRSVLQKKGWRVNSTPAEDARMMKKSIF